jgi:hypothetical protein
VEEKEEEIDGGWGIKAKLRLGRFPLTWVHSLLAGDVMKCDEAARTAILTYMSVV